jgi:hypothetical protein
VIVLLCTVALSAAAADVPSAAQEILDQSGTSAEQSFHWTVSDLLQFAQNLLKENTEKPIHFAVKLFVYLFVSAAAVLMVGGTEWQSCIDTISVLGFTGICLSAMMELLTLVGTASADCQTYLAAFVPVYTGLMTVSGQTAGAAVYSGMFFSMAAFLSLAIKSVLLPVLQIYFCFAVSASLWRNSGISRAAELFGKCVTWLLKGCGTLFTLVLGMQNILAGSTDSAALKLGKNVLSGFIPVVGDAAAAALSSTVTALHLLKGSLAFASVAAIAAILAPVFLLCLFYTLVFWATGIFATASGQKQCGQICSLFAEGTRICSGILLLCFFIAFLSTFLALATAGGG